MALILATTTAISPKSFKIGRCEYEGHPYDMILAGGETTDLRSEARQIFAAITDFLTKIK